MNSVAKNLNNVTPAQVFRRTRLACAISTISTACFMGSGGVLAQDDQQLEEITVTGSRIRSTSGFETSTPVTAVSLTELFDLEPGTPLHLMKFSVDSTEMTPFILGDNASFSGPGALQTMAGGPEAELAFDAWDNSPDGNEAITRATFLAFQYDINDRLAVTLEGRVSSKPISPFITPNDLADPDFREREGLPEDFTNTRPLEAPIGLDNTIRDCVPYNILGHGNASKEALEYMHTDNSPPALPGATNSSSTGP